MTKSETFDLIALMQANYPDEFRTMSDEAIKTRINLWAAMFADDDYQAVKMAVVAHMASDTNRFMPPVGVIKTRLTKMRVNDDMTELEAWGRVKQALRNSSYNSGAEFAKLPPVLQRLVGSPNQLREWAAMDTETLDSVVASNFQRNYKIRAASDMEYLALPSSVKGYIAAIASGFDMDRPRLQDGGANGQR